MNNQPAPNPDTRTRPGRLQTPATQTPYQKSNNDHANTWDHLCGPDPNWLAEPDNDDD